MRVAVIDVGSNTARLLVAEQGRRGTERIGEAKAYLGLGAEIIRRGHVGAEKLAETAEETRRFAAIARELDAEEIDVFVTAPARQAAKNRTARSSAWPAFGWYRRCFCPSRFRARVVSWRTFTGVLSSSAAISSNS